MALDPGTTRFGVALSDETRTIAQPHATVNRRTDQDLVRRLVDLARENQVGELVMGLPLRMDGSEGPEAAEARRLGALLADASQLPLRFADERLTSRQAEREMIRRGDSRQRRRQLGDRVAAALLLQGVLAGARTRP
ncbi:MAG: Holliday junction resolvase RuvX [Candidatus Dormibacteraeota bacterium]|nr:Holliday junction resolvase RuvX [Candidatus Dormibacteraeota bacterium]